MHVITERLLHVVFILFNVGIFASVLSRDKGAEKGRAGWYRVLPDYLLPNGTCFIFHEGSVCKKDSIFVAIYFSLKK